MSVKKRYLKNNKDCRLTFTISKKIGDSFEKISVVGDFNDWNDEVNPLKKSNGIYSASIKVPVGHKYQFRYLGDGVNWMNEKKADEEVPSPFGDSKNSIITV